MTSVAPESSSSPHGAEARPPPPPAPLPQSFSPQARNSGRHDIGSIRRRRSPRFGAVSTGMRRTLYQRQNLKSSSSSLSPPPNSSSTISPMSMASNNPQWHRRRQKLPQRQQCRRTSYSPRLLKHRSKSLSPIGCSPGLSRKSYHQDRSSHCTDGRMIQHTTDETVKITARETLVNVRSGSSDSFISCCSSSYYSEYTIYDGDDNDNVENLSSGGGGHGNLQPPRNHSHLNHHHYHHCHPRRQLSSSHDEYEYEYEEYSIVEEEREDEEDEIEVLDDDDVEDEDARVIGAADVGDDDDGNDENDYSRMNSSTTNSWDSSRDDYDG